MKRLLLILGLILTVALGFSQTSFVKSDLPQYYVQNGDTIGILMTIEQVQKLDNNSELLGLFEKLSIKCDSLDTYYVGVINNMNDKITILNFKVRKQDEAMKKQDDMVNDLKTQVANALFRLNLCEQQRSNDSLIIKGLKQDLSKSKVKNVVGWSTTGISAAVAIFLGIFFGTK
jgi:hypothetical protein